MAMVTGLGAQTGPGGNNDAEERARAFIRYYEEQVRPLEIAVNLAWWKANLSGKDEDFKAKEEAQNKLDAALSNRERFAELKALYGQVKDRVLARQIHLLYLAHLEKQVAPDLLRQIVSKANAVEKAFNVYRARVGERELTDSEVRRVLKQSTDSSYRKAVWEASKAVGAVVEKDLKELVRLRNQAARQLGFPDYHALQLHINEQSQDEVLRLFDELDRLTNQPFRRLKERLDRVLAKQYGLAISDLRPWHYKDPFFQESVADYTADPDAPKPPADLDAVYAKADIVRICRDYFASFGLPVEDILARSDLFEKPGKSPHAFCIDIDREGDVRVLANIVPNEYWMNTMLHELGHAVYSKYIPRTLPYVLRAEAHILTTEGIAMMMERASKQSAWAQAMGLHVPDPEAFDETGQRMLQAQLLIFSRWCQVMLRFEKEMYANPEQDLNRLWWDLVEKYQLVRRPEGRNAPDYASKIHIVSAPCYYHNYMLGEMFACQLHHAIAREVLRTTPDKALYVHRKEVGDFLKQKVFGPGRSMTWQELTRFATGEDLSPQAFARDFGAGQ
ncbi:MAG: M2 family metallopeptidase [Gemmatales bacterium]|nr:M2 family metallopeptidase [Gemmatales bacterium]MCS7160687.1 M2 family metallopeptidase [Gemmatales bacterium]MDW8175888.1 M2 family metallopeptidase [Gemmatales bacterium]MDW8223343.1 M2 family metallopeptidase [Gemmatales bacterium]